MMNKKNPRLLSEGFFEKRLFLLLEHVEYCSQ